MESVANMTVFILNLNLTNNLTVFPFFPSITRHGFFLFILLHFKKRAIIRKPTAKSDDFLERISRDFRQRVVDMNDFIVFDQMD